MPSLGGLHHWFRSKIANSVRTLSKISGMEDRVSHSSCTVLEARGLPQAQHHGQDQPHRAALMLAVPRGPAQRQDRAEGEFSVGVGALSWLWTGLCGFGCCWAGQHARELERFVGWRAWLRGMSSSIPWIWQPQGLGVPLPTWSKPLRLSGPVPVFLKSHFTQANDHC